MQAADDTTCDGKTKQSERDSHDLKLSSILLPRLI